MANCPNCSQDIGEDFGLITCKNCGSQFMLEFDGSIAPAMAPPSEEMSAPIGKVSEVEQPIDAGADTYQSDLPADEFNSEIPQEPAAPDENFLVQPLEAAPIAEDQFSAEFEAAPLEQDVPQQDEPQSYMNEIAEFGNSEDSLGKEGLLRFNIFIKGIDTTQIRTQFRDTIIDPRFLWDADEILGQIKNGELQLSDLTAVKASLLIQRLRPISVDITWEQYAIHQT